MRTDVIQRETMPVPSWLTLRPNVYSPNHAALRDAQAGTGRGVHCDSGRCPEFSMTTRMFFAFASSVVCAA